MPEITQDTQIVSESMQLAPDYKYINAKGGRIGVSVLETTSGEEYTVIHVAANQFYPDLTPKGNGTKVVQCALASIELDASSTRTLYELLGQMLKTQSKE